MRISRIEVSNFRAIAKASIDLEPLTSLIGANNSGKSAFLKALDLFFANAPKVDEDDFHNNNIEEPIHITLTFINLTQDEATLFASNLIDETLTVTRQLRHGSGRESGNFFVEAMVNPDFMACRNEQSKSERRDLYRALQERYNLPNVRNADEVDEKLEAWEAANPQALSRHRVGSFRGWKNVAVGQIKRKTDFVFVPAVREASAETEESRSPAKQLIDALAKQTIENNQDFREFTAQANEKLRQFTDPNNVPALANFSNALSGILRQYYSESELIATWQPISELPIQFPSAAIAVQDHGFISAVDRVGHGLQRAVIITILEFLARERFRGPEEIRQEFEEPASDIIIAIEEPEIYQHPTKQRHISNVLANLTAAFGQQTGIRIQLVLATHSPLFVHLPRFNEVRIVRRHAETPHNVVMSKLTLADCSQALAGFHNPARAPLGDNAFAAKLHIFNAEVSEGFFAKKVVLVEGVSDKAILEAVYKTKGRSPLSEGICIVDVGGKKKLDKPAYIFRALGIPTFVVVDNDFKSTHEEQRPKEIEYNRFLQRVCGVEDAQLSDWPVGVFTRWAAWDGTLEKYISEKCGVAIYNAAKRQTMSDFEVDGEDCVKSPEIASAMLTRICGNGIVFDELDQIIVAIDAVSL